MRVELDHAVMTTSAGSLESRAAEMAARRAQVEGSVDSLLAHWRGDAATRFATLWEEWRSSADAVLDGLSADVAGMRHAHDLMTCADQSTGEAHTRLRGRLG